MPLGLITPNTFASSSTLDIEVFVGNVRQDPNSAYTLSGTTLTFTGDDYGVYIDNNGNKARPFMVHRAIFGSLERFLGVLIEHYSGKFPLWLSSNQVKILCLSDQIVDYCKNIQHKMSLSGLKVKLDSSSEKLGYKIKCF